MHHTWPGDDDASEPVANTSTASTATARNRNLSLKEEVKKTEKEKQNESNAGYFEVISAGELSNDDDETIKFHLLISLTAQQVLIWSNHYAIYDDVVYMNYL